MTIRPLILSALLAATSLAQANPIFSDNFDKDALRLNQATFLTGWQVAGGTVDLIGAIGFYDLMPGHGRYVDLDGSSHQAGILSRTWELLAGVTYSANFFLAGNHRKGGDERVEVSFGEQRITLVIGQDQRFAQTSLLWTPSATGKYTLSFHNLSNDNLGALLDDISLNIMPRNQNALAPGEVPEPASGWLLLAGMAGIGFMRRRRASRTR